MCNMLTSPCVALHSREGTKAQVPHANVGNVKDSDESILYVHNCDPSSTDLAPDPDLDPVLVNRHGAVARKRTRTVSV